MTTKQRQSIDRVRDYLLHAEIDEDRKDVLQVLLDKADEAANGCGPDTKLQLLSEIMHMYIIDHIREAIRSPQRYRELAAMCVAAHTEAEHRQRVTIREALIQSVTSCPYAAAAVAIVWMVLAYMG